MSIPDLLGWAGVAIVPFIGLPQLYKVWKWRSPKGVSFGTYIGLTIAQAFLLVHAIDIADTTFMLTSGIGWCVNTTVLLSMWYFKRKKEANAPTLEP